MRYFIVTDVHSCYDELVTELSNNGFNIHNDEHIFVSCGDLLDRGPKPLETLKFVLSIPEHRRQLIYGNHEYLMESLIHRGFVSMHDCYNGTANTIRHTFNCEADQVDSRIIDFANLPEWKNYIAATKDYFEFGDYICVHGWIPCKKEGDNYTAYEDDWRQKSFNESRWFNGMEAWNTGVREPGKTIICGHVCCSYGHHYLEQSENPDSVEPFIDEGIRAMDSHVFRTGKLNCFVVDV